ncbi:MAG TPA: PAS domain-containing protein [Desulfomonilaceae bacterium]|nr:PAS domain-containing protein [Desulfomonilaceae bacterium]
MNTNAAPDFDSDLHPPYTVSEQLTQTLDLQDLFNRDANESGFFDLSDIGSTAFGNLLHALPVPVLLVDKWFLVVFANQSCTKMSNDYNQMTGRRFTDLLSTPKDESRASALRNKTLALLERVFSERKPYRAEAILKSGNTKVWTRLHLRTVRLVSDRHIMVIIEDITSERAHERVSQKDEIRMREEFIELNKRLRNIAWDLSETTVHLKREISDHDETRKKLDKCLEEQVEKEAHQ